MASKKCSTWNICDNCHRWSLDLRRIVPICDRIFDSAFIESRTASFVQAASNRENKGPGCHRDAPFAAERGLNSYSLYAL